jgi:hypothetical protein
MTPGAGVHLHDLRAGALDPLAIIGRGLIAFEYIECYVVSQVTDGSLEQRGLAGPGTAHQVEGKYLSFGEPCPIGSGECIVLGQHARPEFDEAVWPRGGVGMRNFVALGGGTIVQMLMQRDKATGLKIGRRHTGIGFATAILTHYTASSTMMERTLISSPRNRTSWREPQRQALSSDGVSNSLPHAVQRPRPLIS